MVFTHWRSTHSTSQVVSLVSSFISTAWLESGLRSYNLQQNERRRVRNPAEASTPLLLIYPSQRSPQYSKHCYLLCVQPLNFARDVCSEKRISRLQIAYAELITSVTCLTQVALRVLSPAFFALIVASFINLGALVSKFFQTGVPQRHLISIGSVHLQKEGIVEEDLRDWISSWDASLEAFDLREHRRFDWDCASNGPSQSSWRSHEDTAFGQQPWWDR